MAKVKKEKKENALLMTTIGLLSGVEGAHFFRVC